MKKFIISYPLVAGALFLAGIVVGIVLADDPPEPTLNRP